MVKSLIKLLSLLLVPNSQKHKISKFGNQNAFN